MFLLQVGRIAVGVLALVVIAFHSANAGGRAGVPMLFVAEQQTNAVYIFNADNLQAPALGKITDGIHLPSAIAVDSHGVLYVANAPNNHRPDLGFVSVYAPGSVHPQKKLRFGFVPESIAVGADGTLAIAGAIFGKSGTLLIYDKGSQTPTRRINIPLGQDLGMQTGGIAIDGSDDVVMSVLVYPHDTRMIEVAPGSRHGVVLKISPGAAQGFDAPGNLFVGAPYIIVEYEPTFHNVLRQITNGLAGVSGMAVTSDGHVFATNIFGSQGFIVEYAQGPNPIQMRQGPDTIYPTGAAYLPAPH